MFNDPEVGQEGPAGSEAIGGWRQHSRKIAACDSVYSELSLRNETSSADPGVRPIRLVALDSSQLGDLARDWFSPDPGRRGHAKRIHNALTAEAAIPLLCFHHLEELLQHENDAVVARRISFLRSLPAVAWVKTADGTPGLGTIVDILCAEARSALSDLSLNAKAVTEAAKRSLIKIGSGTEALAPYDAIWPALVMLARSRAPKSREIVAITSGNIPVPPDLRVSQLTPRLLRNPLEAQRLTLTMQESLAHDIAARGDRRIPDPHGVAEGFFERVRGEARFLYAPSSNPILEDLERRGIDSEDLAGDPTVNELIELIEYRAKLEVVTEACGLDCTGLRPRAAMRRLPTWMIEHGLRVYGQRRLRNAGGDLTDRQLACLAPYAKVVFVDKRTTEDVRRARAADGDLERLLQSIAKAGPYAKVAGVLRERRQA